VIAFIHDEILLEIPDDGDFDEEIELIRHIICGSMQELTGSVPIECEVTLSRMWSKNAKLVRNVEGNVIIWEPE
jgi:DNA polymerase I-like protein with 3'-5' exonuclease and polymerase domains